MKIIIKSLLLAAILLIGSCQSKPSKSNQLVVKTDTVVVDTPKFDLTSVVAPSLADEFVKLVNSLAEASVSADSAMSAGRDHVFQVYFYQENHENFVRLFYLHWFQKNMCFPVPAPQRINGKYVAPKYNDEDYIIPLDGYIIHKNVLFTFYNLIKQGNAGTLVDSTKIKKDKPIGFQSLEELLGNGEGVDTYDGWGKIFKIHSKDSLELVFNGMM